LARDLRCAFCNARFVSCKAFITALRAVLFAPPEKGGRGGGVRLLCARRAVVGVTTAAVWAEGLSYFPSEVLVSSSAELSESVSEALYAGSGVVAGSSSGIAATYRAVRRSGARLRIGAAFGLASFGMP
jgi:hypothetical protein